MLNLILLIPAFVGATAFAESDCESRLLPSRDGTSERFIFGSSTYLNLSLLRNFESIDPSVLDRFNQEVAAVEQVTRQESHQIALAYFADPTELNRVRLFNATRILVPIASRHLLARLRSADELEDYFQTGYAGLWEAIPSIPSIKPRKIKKLIYWEGVANGLRKQIFYNMRRLFRASYSLTPVSMPKTAEFTFEEEILLFGSSVEDRAKIAADYGQTPLRAEREWIKQIESVAHNLATNEAAEPESVEQQIEDRLARQELEKIIRRRLPLLSPRLERIIRQVFFKGLTHEQVADEFGLSTQRIRQLEARAVRQVAEGGTRRKLEPYINGRYQATLQDDLDRRYERDLAVLHRTFEEKQREKHDAELRRERQATEARARRAEEARLAQESAEREAAEANLARAEAGRLQAVARRERTHRKAMLADMSKLKTELGAMIRDIQRTATRITFTDPSEEVWAASAPLIEHLNGVETWALASIEEKTQSGVAFAREAELIQERQALEVRITAIKHHLEALLPLLRGSHERIKEQAGVLAAVHDAKVAEERDLRTAHEALKNLLDRGNRSSLVESQRAELAQQLRLKTTEIEHGERPYQDEILAGFSTIKILLLERIQAAP